ncbi:LysE family translocator [Thalassovita sp.]|uniref:LysE family translocator n=1 Tax=Thalassovita sp. TaxID=1979401 RepID=UPI002AB2069D|nr:LysE family translocator [Thalassovita sp.]
MSFESWGSYAMACLVLSLIPGPSVLLIIGQALSLGMRGAMACLAGALLGGLGLILGALAGLGAVLASSAVLFQAIKWAGIAYLLWLGVTQLRLARRTKAVPSDAPAPQSVKGSFRSGFLTALLNPKSLVFYLAFLSQFLDPAHSTWISYVQLIVTSIVIAGISLLAYALLAERLRQRLTSPTAQRQIKMATGGLYLGGGALMAASR